MTFTKQLLSILAFATIGFSACSNPPTTPIRNWDDEYGIIATPLTITAKLQSKILVNLGDNYGEKPIPWEQGAGKLVAWNAWSAMRIEVPVSEDGSFTMTLPGSLKYSSLVNFRNGDSTLSESPANFLSLMDPLRSFFFYPLDNPTTPEIDESLAFRGIISPKLIREQDSCAYQAFEFMMSEEAALSFGSADKRHKYNYTYKKGWNIGTWKEENGVSVYSIVDSLPANVVWF